MEGLEVEITVRFLFIIPCLTFKLFVVFFRFCYQVRRAILELWYLLSLYHLRVTTTTRGSRKIEKILKILTFLNFNKTFLLLKYRLEKIK